MTRQEFNTGWAVLIAALGFETAESQDELYFRGLRDVTPEAFTAGVRALVLSPDFAEYARFRRLPTLSELREECEAKADRREPLIRWGQESIPLAEYFRRIDAAEVPARASTNSQITNEVTGNSAVRPALLPGQANAGHANLLILASALAAAERDRRGEGPHLSPEEWESRRARLLKQMDELLGAGEPVER